jgi:DNA replication and repair protein RecF
VRLRTISAADFRNLAAVELEPSARATVVVGQNGQGKTNLLEAVYFLCTLRPLRAAKLGELVRFGAEQASVQGTFTLQGADRTIRVEVQDGARVALVDGKRAQSLLEYFGGVSVVAFTPDDLEVVKGGPEQRRWFLDRAVFNRFPAYLEESRDYARALKSRNRLLKERAEPAYLAAFEEALVRTGARLWTRRRALLGELAPRAERAFAAIGRADRPARYTYAPSHLKLPFETASEPELAEAFVLELRRRLERDLERGFTSVGPHADDLGLWLGERPARSFASQGQQRAFVLSWKIGEIENLQAAHGVLPLLLLDDVSSELDPERNAYLMGYLRDSGAQTFLTTTDAQLVRRAAGEDAAWFEVLRGAISAGGPKW